MRKTYAYLICLVLSISATRLKAQNCWSPLGSGTNGYIEAIVTYNGNLIAGGVFDSAGGIAANNIAAWNGSSWSALGSGLSIDTAHSLNMDIEALAVYNGELYAGGQFDTAGGITVNNIAKWNGTTWSPVSSGIPGARYTVHALTVYNGALYAGGFFDTAGGIRAHNIAKWDGTQWSGANNGLLGSPQDEVFCLVAYDSILYAGGFFDSAGNINAINIAAWNGTAWSTVGSGVSSNGGVNAIVFYDGILYAAVFGYPATDTLKQWDGTSWSNVSNVKSEGFYDVGINQFLVFNDRLIVGGGFDTIGGIAAGNIAQWDGSSWSSLNAFSGIYTPQVDVMSIYDGHLFVGGDFSNVDSTATNSIAEYTCATDGIHNIPAGHVHVYPNPTTGMVNITIDNAGAGSSVQVYDLLGQKVFQSGINSGNTSINLSGQAPGSYIYHVSGVSGESISAGALIIQ